MPGYSTFNIVMALNSDFVFILKKKNSDFVLAGSLMNWGLLLLIILITKLQ